MLQLIAKLKLNASILSIGRNKNNTIIIDSNYYLYEIHNKEFLFSKQIFDFGLLHPFSKSCSVGMHGYIAVGEPKSNKCHVLSLNNGNLVSLKTLSWHRADIYNIRFSRDGKYLVTGGEDGKVFIFSLPSFNLISILPPRPDYISNVHFGRELNLIVYSSYDMLNCVFDIDRNSIIGKFQTNAVVEDIVFFDNDSKIFFICSNGESGIYTIATNSICLKNNYKYWLTRVGLSKDDNYAYIGGRNDELSYLFLENNAPQYKINLEHNSGISAMRIIDSNLYIGYGDGYLEIFDLCKYENEFLESINKKDYKKAYEISNNNISLKTYKTYIGLMNEAWEREFKKEMENLNENNSSDNLKDSYSRLEIFFEDIEKKNEFNKFIANIGPLKEFNKAFIEKDYVKAYGVAENNEFIKNMEEFEKLENLFNDAFLKARDKLQDNAINDANAILKPFSGAASKKEIINALFKNYEKFIQAEKLFKSKHFADYFKLADNFKLLQNTDTYKKALAIGEQVIATINQLEANKNFNKEMELIDFLIKLIPFKMAGEKLKNDLNTKIEFIELFNAKRYMEIFNSIEKYAFLKGIKEYVKLNEIFNAKFEKALELSHIGNTDGVYKELESTLGIEFWKERINNIFNLSYLHEIDENIKNNMENVNWKTTIGDYVNMFGKSDELKKICEDNEEKGKEIINIFNTIESSENLEIKYLKSIITLI